MADNDLQLRFDGDASGVKAAAGDAVSAIQSLGPAIDAASKVLDLFQKAVDAAFKKPKTDELTGAAAQSSAALAGAANGYAAIAQAAIAAGEAIASWANQLGKAGLETERLSQKLGVGVETTQAYQGIATLLGTDVDDVAGKVASGAIGLDQYNALLDQYGVRNQDAAAKGAALGHAFDQNKLANQGLNEVLTQAFGPVMKDVVDDVNKLTKAFTDSYSSGGVVKIGMDILAIAVKAVVAVVDILTTFLKELWDLVKAVGIEVLALAEALSGVLKTAVEIVGGAFVSLGRQISLALAGHADQAVAEAARYGASVREMLGEEQRNWAASDAKINDDRARMREDMLNDATGFAARMKALITDDGSSSPAPNAGRAAAAKTVARATGAAGQASGGGGGGEGTDREQLDRERQIDSLPKFDPAPVIAASKDAAQAQTADIQSVASLTKQAYQDQLSAVQTADREGVISHQEARDDTLSILRAQQTAEVQAIAAVRDAKIAADQFARSLIVAGTAQDIELKKDEATVSAAAEKEMTAVIVEENKKRAQIDKTAANEAKAAWDRSMGATIRTFSQGLLQMAEGTKSFGQVMASIGQQILQGWVTRSSKMVSDWIFGEMAKTGATQAGAAARLAAEQQGNLKARVLSFETAEKDIFNSAAKSAAAAFHAFASNPLTLPFAPVAAAAAFSAVEAFGNIASAAGGFDIPSGVNPLVQAHQNEMILPARIANPLRRMVSDYNPAQTRDSSDARRGGGDFHFSPSIHAMDGKSVEALFNRHSDKLVRVIRQAHGRGAFSGVFP